MKDNCPCGSSSSYKICCGPYHLGNLFPPTAEALMRSRFTAFVMNKPRYIFQTWHKDTRPTLESIRNSTTLKFTSLKVVNKDLGLADDDIGTVTFVALYKEGEEILEFKELSSFKRVDKRWVYFKGEEEHIG